MIDRSKWWMALAVWFAVVSPTAAQTREGLPPTVQQALDEWDDCRLETIKVRLTAGQSAEAITDAAFAACQAEQEKASAAAVKAFGPSGAADILSYKNNARAETITFIDESLRGKPSSDPMVAWGECLGKQGTHNLSMREKVEIVADRAFAACKSFEAQATAEIVRDSGPGASAELSATRKAMRDTLIDIINEARSNTR